MKTIFLTFILLITSSFLLFRGIPDPFATQIEQNTELLKEIQIKKNEFSKNPNNFDLAMNLAELYFNVGSHKESEKYYKKAILIDDKKIDGHLKLGNLYRFQGNFIESEKEFNRALELNPSHLVYDELGKLFRNWQKYELAIKMFEKAIEINPQDDWAYGYGLGYLYRDMGDLKNAEKFIKKAFEINQSPFNYRALGDIYREQKKYSESEIMFKKAIEVDPIEKDNEGLAWLYFEEGKFKMAEKEFRDYLVNVRPKGEVYYGLARSLFSQGKIKEAKDANIKAIELNGKTVGFYDFLAQIYATEGKRSAAWATQVRKSFVENNYSNSRQY